MPGADIVTVAVHDDKTVEIADRFATQKALPEEDGCSHWTLISATEASGMTTVEITRLLDTGDEQDRPFTPGLMKVKLHQFHLLTLRLSMPTVLLILLVIMETIVSSLLLLLFLVLLFLKAILLGSQSIWQLHIK